MLSSEKNPKPKGRKSDVFWCHDVNVPANVILIRLDVSVVLNTANKTSVNVKFVYSVARFPHRDIDMKRKKQHLWYLRKDLSKKMLRPREQWLFPLKSITQRKLVGGWTYKARRPLFSYHYSTLVSFNGDYNLFSFWGDTDKQPFSVTLVGEFIESVSFQGCNVIRGKNQQHKYMTWN